MKEAISIKKKLEQETVAYTELSVQLPNPDRSAEEKGFPSKAGGGRGGRQSGLSRIAAVALPEPHSLARQ